MNKITKIDIFIFVLVILALPFVFFPELMTDTLASILKYGFAMLMVVYIFIKARRLK